MGVATIPGAKTCAPLNTAEPHWAPTTTSDLSGARDLEGGDNLSFVRYIKG